MEVHSKHLASIPKTEEVAALLGAEAYGGWQELNGFIHSHYDTDIFWDIGRKGGVYELKYRRNGKTLCSLFPRAGNFSFMVIFGRKERERFEADRTAFSTYINDIYDRTHQYRDGKWLMLEVRDGAMLPQLQQLLILKKRPKTS